MVLVHIQFIKETCSLKVGHWDAAFLSLDVIGFHWISASALTTENLFKTYFHKSPFALCHSLLSIDFFLGLCFNQIICIPSLLGQKIASYDVECQHCHVHWVCVYSWHVRIWNFCLKNSLSQSLWCTNSLPCHSTPQPSPGGNTIRVNRPWVWWVPAAKVTVWCPKGQWDPTAPRSKVGGKARPLFHVEIYLVTLHWLC